MIVKRLENGGIEILTPAKVNLFLEVLGRRSDGYHEIVSVIEPVSFYDKMIMHPSGSGVKIECADNTVPADASNTIAKAWAAMKKRRPELPGIEVRLEKKIPSGAGLGGGSSNAAGALLAMNEIFSLGMSRKELAEIGAEVGSDVPVFFAGGMALVRGRGEKIEEIKNDIILYYVIVLSKFGCPTEKIYKNLKSALTAKNLNDILLKIGNRDWTRGALFNRLEESAFSLFPELAKLKETLVALHAGGVVMSGSGSSIICVCRTSEEAAKLRSEIGKLGAVRCVEAHSAAY